MKKNIFYISIILAAVAIGVLGLFMGYRYVNPEPEISLAVSERPEPSEQDESYASYEISPVASPEPGPEFSPSPTPESKSESDPEPERIQPATKIIYEYHYGDDRVEIKQEEPPYFLLEMTEESMSAAFSDWEMISFSSNQVVMRKYVEEKSPSYYVVGIQDGYVAVFYQTPTESSLRQVTDTPVGALSADERHRLSSGIKIYDDENLVKVLEDYGS